MAAPIKMVFPASQRGIIQITRLAGSVASGSQAPPKAPSKPAKSSAGQDKPTDSTKYNVPDYYGHNAFSYYDIDAQAQKFRLSQPSKFDPLKPKK